MKRLISVTLGIFLVLVLIIVLFEYQPWYNPKTNPAPLDNRNQVEEVTIDEKEDYSGSTTLSENLYVKDVLDKEEFLEKLLEDDYDFSDIAGDYRNKIIQYHSNSLYKECWDILKNHATIKTIKEKEGMTDDYITLELTYFAPKNNSDAYTQAIVRNYDGSYDSVKDYIDVYFATSNIKISRETDYVVIDENFYEFIILEDNKDKLYSDTVNLQDYVITLWYDPYTS